MAAPAGIYETLLEPLLNRVFGGDSLALVYTLFETKPPDRCQLDRLEPLLEELRQKHSGKDGGSIPSTGFLPGQFAACGRIVATKCKKHPLRAIFGYALPGLVEWMRVSGFSGFPPVPGSRFVRPSRSFHGCGRLGQGQIAA